MCVTAAAHVNGGDHDDDDVDCNGKYTCKMRKKNGPILSTWTRQMVRKMCVYRTASVGHISNGESKQSIAPEIIH